MPLASASVFHDADSVANFAIEFLGQDDGNEVQHNFFGDAMTLLSASVSCDPDSIISGTITFLRS